MYELILPLYYKNVLSHNLCVFNKYVLNTNIKLILRIMNIDCSSFKIS